VDVEDESAPTLCANRLSKVVFSAFSFSSSSSVIFPSVFSEPSAPNSLSKLSIPLANSFANSAENASVGSADSDAEDAGGDATGGADCFCAADGFGSGDCVRSKAVLGVLIGCGVNWSIRSGRMLRNAKRTIFEHFDNADHLNRRHPRRW
jgi:hypothetical protein